MDRGNEAQEAAFAAAETPITSWLVKNRVKTDLSKELEELEVEYAKDLLALDDSHIVFLRARMKNVSRANFDPERRDAYGSQPLLPPLGSMGLKHPVATSLRRLGSPGRRSTRGRRRCTGGSSLTRRRRRGWSGW